MMSFAVDLYIVRVSDPKIQNQPPVSLCSPEKIIFTKFIFFSPGEIILEKIFGFSILFVFRVWFVYRSKNSEDPEDL